MSVKSAGLNRLYSRTMTNIEGNLPPSKWKSSEWEIVSESKRVKRQFEHEYVKVLELFVESYLNKISTTLADATLRLFREAWRNCGKS